MRTDSGDHTESPLRNPRQSEKCFSIRYIRAQDETSRFRATTRRQNTTFIAHFGRCQKFAFRSVLPLSHKSRAFAGTLYLIRFRPRHSVEGFSTRHSRALDETSRFQATTRRQNTTFIAHFGRCQKFAFRSVLPSSHKSSAFVGALYLIRFRPRQSEKCFSIRYIRAQDETSRFRATTRRQNTTFIAHFGRCQKFAFRSVLPSSHKSSAFVGALRIRISKSAARRHMVFLLAFPNRKASHFRPVPPSSHKSRAFAGTLRSPQMALAKRQRSAFCGKEEASAPKAKVFRRKTEQLRRATTMGQGSALQIESGDHMASEHALFSSLFLTEKHRFFGGSSFIPQKQSFCGSPIPHPISSAALGKMFFRSYHPRTGSSVTLARFLYWEIYVIR